MMYEANRQRLIDMLDGGLLVVSAYDAMQLSGDMAAPFLQEASFFWLTGIAEPGWKLIVESSRRHATLVRPQRSEIDIIFNGQSDDDEIKRVSGINQIISHDEFEPTLRRLSQSHPMVRTIIDETQYDFTPNPAGRDLVATLRRIFSSVQDCSLAIHKLRAIKQPDEIKKMQRAIDLTAKAFGEVRQLLETQKSEAEVEAEFSYRFRRAGATHAYAPIVASGKNACTLHYESNNAKINSRSMVLIDIGARVDGYSADITRTYCTNPTTRQREVHAAVERAEKAIIDLIKPGLPVSEYALESDRIMKRALQSIGLLDNLNDEATFRKYFPHAISHGLGVDTHDSLGKPRTLEPGMVLTVEPGIYIPEEKIGVRIEDDILVTENGHRNLSKKLPTGL